MYHVVHVHVLFGYMMASKSRRRVQAMPFPMPDHPAPAPKLKRRAREETGREPAVCSKIRAFATFFMRCSCFLLVFRGLSEGFKAYVGSERRFSKRRFRSLVNAERPAEAGRVVTFFALEHSRGGPFLGFVGLFGAEIQLRISRIGWQVAFRAMEGGIRLSSCPCAGASTWRRCHVAAAK